MSAQSYTTLINSTIEAKCQLEKLLQDQLRAFYRDIIQSGHN